MGAWLASAVRRVPVHPAGCRAAVRGSDSRGSSDTGGGGMRHAGRVGKPGAYDTGGGYDLPVAATSILRSMLGSGGVGILEAVSAWSTTVLSKDTCRSATTKHSTRLRGNKTYAKAWGSEHPRRAAGGAAPHALHTARVGPTRSAGGASVSQASPPGGYLPRHAPPRYPHSPTARLLRLCLPLTSTPPRILHPSGSSSSSVLGVALTSGVRGASCVPRATGDLVGRGMLH